MASTKAQNLVDNLIKAVFGSVHEKDPSVVNARTNLLKHITDAEVAKLIPAKPGRADLKLKPTPADPAMAKAVKDVKSGMYSVKDAANKHGVSVYQLGILAA